MHIEIAPVVEADVSVYSDGKSRQKGESEGDGERNATNTRIPGSNPSSSVFSWATALSLSAGRGKSTMWSGAEKKLKRCLFIPILFIGSLYLRLENLQSSFSVCLIKAERNLRAKNTVML